jgi:Fur family ferric uptake transcriptional regulator
MYQVSDRLFYVKELLAEKGYRLTPQREAVLNVIMEWKDAHLAAEEVHRKAKEKCRGIGIATVYRTLEIFEALDIVHKLQFGEERALYEFNPGYHRHCHHHIICLGCGEILEFNKDLLNDIEEAVACETGFLIVNHALAVYGYCLQCQGNQKRNRK